MVDLTSFATENAYVYHFLTYHFAWYVFIFSRYSLMTSIFVSPTWSAVTLRHKPWLVGLCNFCHSPFAHRGDYGAFLNSGSYIPLVCCAKLPDIKRVKLLPVIYQPLLHYSVVIMKYINVQTLVWHLTHTPHPQIRTKNRHFIEKILWDLLGDHNQYFENHYCGSQP